VEALPTEPVKLLEVNARSIPTGIQGVYFGPDPSAGILFPSIVYEVTPGEFERIERGELPLPAGMRMTTRFERGAPVAGNGQ